MKKLAFILLVCCGVFCFSCGMEQDEQIRDGDTFLSDIQSLTLSEDSDFPEWLSTKIKEVETLNAGDVAIIKIKIFEGEWRNRKVYFIYNNLSSCMFCEVYYDNGEKIEWSDEDISSDNFSSTSKNWKLIYKFGNFVECHACGVDQPQENLPWLKELIEKAKADTTGNYLGFIWLEHYNGTDIFVTNMMLGSGGIANYYFDCTGAHAASAEGYCPSAFVGDRHFTIDDKDFWSHIENNPDSASVVIYSPF